MMDEKTKAVADRVRRDRGKVYRPSNGTEGEMFMSRWCDRCTLDESRGGKCDRVARAMAYPVAGARLRGLVRVLRAARRGR
jgi:hypothetical protein